MNIERLTDKQIVAAFYTHLLHPCYMRRSLQSYDRTTVVKMKTKLIREGYYRFNKRQQSYINGRVFDYTDEVPFSHLWPLNARV